MSAEEPSPAGSETPDTEQMEGEVADKPTADEPALEKTGGKSETEGPPTEHVSEENKDAVLEEKPAPSSPGEEDGNSQTDPPQRKPSTAAAPKRGLSSSSMRTRPAPPGEEGGTSQTASPQRKPSTAAAPKRGLSSSSTGTRPAPPGEEGGTSQTASPQRKPSTAAAPKRGLSSSSTRTRPAPPGEEGGTSQTASPQRKPSTAAAPKRGLSSSSTGTRPAPPGEEGGTSQTASPQRKPSTAAAPKRGLSSSSKAGIVSAKSSPAPPPGANPARVSSTASPPSRGGSALAFPARSKEMERRASGGDRARDGSAGAPGPKVAPLSAANVKGSLWQQVLSDARSAKTAEQRDSYLIMLGSYDVGKSTVLRQLQTLGSVKPLSAIETYTNTGGVSLLDFAYIGQRCLEEEEDLSSVDAHSYASVYILQHPQLAGRLVELLPPSALPNMCFLICLDMRQAWSAMDELEKWMHVAENITNTLLAQQDVETQDGLRNRMQRYLASYRRNATSNGVTRAVTALLDLQNFGSVAGGASEELVKSLEAEKAKEASSGAEISSQIPVPVIVAVTRSDAYQHLNSRQNMGQIDIMMAYLRRECLKFNAAIVACSCRDERNPRNLLLLYRYLMHRLCNCFFKELPVTDDVEAFFMPSGFDTVEDIQKAVEQTVAGSFELEDQTNTAVPIQTMQEFLRQMEEQFPAAAVAAKPMGEKRFSLLSGAPSASGAFGRTESGRRSLVAGSQRPTISIQPSANFARPEMQPTKAYMSGPGAEGLDKIRTRAEVPRLRSSVLATKTIATSSSSVSPGAGGAESASLQNFFQGLLAKNKTKVPATPRGRVRPKTGPEAEQKKAPGEA
ncbi:GA28568, related [Neospora caninum Liverpool]|uniref:GA28568, related n=1 Tax=Neospora caninum (strain Liverpool) TaxID=572307 RepID=F0VQU4_NEOCL|nr:GA28568, related [Neospora caninum Liverpool]CBZ56091.1 GA28568, related [Neospora caninum Liverpool]|eukprot:XP_003886117.1 GA28568, related [Neospora caninum Liverpool]